MSIVLRGWLGTGGISNERFSVTFQHHKTMKTLKESNEVVGCSICRALTHELEKREELDVTEDTEITIQAELTRLEDQDNLAFRKGSEDRAIFRLDFILEKQQLGPRMEVEKTEILLRTFALKPTSKPPFPSSAPALDIYALSFHFNFFSIQRGSATDFISFFVHTSSA
jgi:hypothetical protein